MKDETHEFNTPLPHTVQQGGVSIQKYDVTCDGLVAGLVQLTKEGLYTRFQCVCQLPDKGIFRLYMFCRDQKTDLGVFVPMKSQFTVNKCLQSKYVPDGELSFQAVAASQDEAEIFIPVCADAPFANISLIVHSRLCNRDGRYGILIVNQSKSK